MPFEKNVLPQKGDLLRIRRPIGYYHFGIALNNKEVIHFSGSTSDNDLNDIIMIRRSPLSIFVKEDELEVMVPYESPFDRDLVLSKAKEFVDSKEFRGKTYDFLLNNCEHFARYCYYGNPESKQVKHGLEAFVTRAEIFLSKIKKEKSPEETEDKIIEIK